MQELKECNVYAFYFKLGWRGQTCQEDYCVLQPCKNGATCSQTQTQAGYQCACPVGYKGVQCEVDVCNPDDCVHGKCM